MHGFLKQVIGHALVLEPQVQAAQGFSCFGEESVTPVLMRTRERYILSDEGLIFLKLEKIYLLKMLEHPQGQSPIPHHEMAQLLGNVLANVCIRTGMRFLWPYMHRWHHWPIGYLMEEYVDAEKRNFCKGLWDTYEEAKSTMRALGIGGEGEDPGLSTTRQP